MEEIAYRSDMGVHLVDSFGSDAAITRAARVSVIGAAAQEVDADVGLIRYLMKHSHGSPFEHNAMTFLVDAPIFVFREFMRHRVGFSFNEVSGRYREAQPVFYTPSTTRDLVQTTSSARPTFARGNELQAQVSQTCHREAYAAAWAAYTEMLTAGVAREVARSVLPVGLYSSAYVTCNARSLMSFLALRTQHEAATTPSWPQEEIQMVARPMETIFATLFPITAAAFTAAGRVAP